MNEHDDAYVDAMLIVHMQANTRSVTIPTDQPHFQCLDPLGNPDPTDLINVETNRIPFRAENISLDLWKDAFRS